MAKGSSGIGGGSANKQSTQQSQNIESFSMSDFSNVVASYGNSALTSAKIDDFADRINASTAMGDSFSVTEPNRYHTITEHFVRQPDGQWRYIRQNRDDGSIYEDTLVSTRRVADQILSTALGNDSFKWRMN